MTDAEKNVIIEIKKKQIRNMYPPDVADERCKKVDEAKKQADVLELLVNSIQETL